MSLPTVVSFYAGAQYYYDCGDRLRQDCERLGLKHDIREIEKPDGWDWADLCRLKIPFYRDLLRAHPDGIVWVDVDTRIVRRPDFMAFGGYDFGAFLRNFKSFRDYDPALFGRRFHPGFVYFSGSERSMEFCNHLSELEAENRHVKGTDDYFLEEGFRSFPKGLGIHVFNNDHIAFSEECLNTASFLFGASGNVGSFIDKVEQHHAVAFEVGRERASLIRHFRIAASRGRRDEAEAIIRAALRIDPKHKETALMAASYLVRVMKPKLALHALKAAFDMRVAPDEAQKLAIEANLLLEQPSAARLGLRRLSKESSTTAFRKSRDFRVSLEERAAELGLERGDRPALWWMEQPFPGNFGDVLNPYIVEQLSGLPPRFVAKGDGILAIGSVIKFAKPGTDVWGTGTPRLTDKLSPDANYHAVRGPLTRQLVIDSGGNCPPVFGDAAMLLPLIKGASAKKHKLGFIRHYTHAEESLNVSDDVFQIDLARVGYKDIESFIDEVTSCDAIISTSLHGLIVAHAYGIPTRRAIFSESERQIPGDGTKFSDHYLAFGIDELDPIDLSFHSNLSVEDAEICKEVVNIPLKAVQLLNAAPFPVQSQMMEKARNFDLLNSELSS
ncbi:polysaccharide pyruvyl transferase family protein [Sphingobium yanoikuyae]|uniref:polysaccharide pyruvyl transferase family protein n=1 Tax=Sphingobium yanoikuyae TaxID=13690 RepID=UPI002FDAC5B1